MALYQINRWFWWMSNDDYVWQSGAVYDAQNVDVWNSKGVKLSRSFNFTIPSTLFTSSQWKPVALIEWNSFTKRLIASKNWILKEFSWTEIDISWTVSTIYNVWEIQVWNLNYWFILWDNWNIYKWQLNEASNDLWVGSGGANISLEVQLSADIWWWSSFFYDISPYISKGSILYVVWWNTAGHNVFWIDTTTTPWTVNTNYLALDRWFSVSYISTIWDQIIVYATNWDHWKQYYWDWFSQYPNRVIDWYNRPILWGATINNIDYVITGTQSKRELYMVNGYQPVRITATDIWIFDTEREKFFYDMNWTNTIETIQDTLVLPGDWQIYKYWNNKVWLPKAITRDKIFWKVNLVYYNNANSDNLIVCSESSDFSWTFKYLIETTSLKKPDDNVWIYPVNNFWSIETLKYQWWNYFLKKQSVKFKIGYNLSNLYNSTTIYDNWINIYARVDNGYEYVNFYTYRAYWWYYTIKPSIGDVYSYDWQNFEVYNITDRINNEAWTLNEDKWNWIIIHTKCQNTRYSISKRWSLNGTLTKVSWDWDSNFYFYKSDEWYELVGKIRAINELETTSKSFMFNKNFNEIQFKFDLFTNNSIITPILNDFILEYNIIQNDIQG